MSDAPKLRGFAAMDPEKRLAFARMGGKAVLKENRTFRKGGDLAREAGRKGGNAPKKPREKLTDPVE